MAVRVTLNSGVGSLSFPETSADGVSYSAVNIYKLRGLLCNCFQ